MRILMVTEDIPAVQVGGLGKHVVTLSNALIAAGHDVVLMGGADLRYEDHATEIGFNGRFIGGFSLARSGWKESQLGVWMPLKRQTLARRIERAIVANCAGFDVVHYHGHLPLVGHGLPQDLAYLQTRHDQGSECLTHTRFRDGDVCDRLRHSDCAVCRTSAPNAIQTAVSALAVRQYRMDVAANYSRRKTVFVSEFLRQQFARVMQGVDLSRSEVLHNFIDLGRLRKILTAPLLPSRRSVMMAGRVDETKGFAQFLHAWREAPADAELLVIGDGPQRQSLQNAFAGMAEFAGWMAYPDVIARTAQASVCVVPSVWQEPCGTTVLEALALGRPVIALRRGGTPELAQYQRYESQLQLADDMAGVVRLTQQALERQWPMLPVAESSDADIGAKLPKLLELYERVIGDSRRAVAP